MKMIVGESEINKSIHYFFCNEYFYACHKDPYLRPKHLEHAKKFNNEKEAIEFLKPWKKKLNETRPDIKWFVVDYENS